MNLITLPIPPAPGKKIKKKGGGENRVEYSAVLYSPRWDQFHPDWRPRIQVPHAAGMMETDSLQVCVLCTRFSLFFTLHTPTPIASGVLGPHGWVTTACPVLSANRPPPASQADWHLMVEVTICDHSSSSNIVWDGNATAGSALLTHLPVLLKSAKDILPLGPPSLSYVVELG